MTQDEREYAESIIELENSGTMFVRVTSEDGQAWYDNRIGETFKVYKNPVMYRGGMGYKCVDICGGITLNNCEVVE